MARGPEGTFKSSLNRKLKDHIHIDALGGMFSRGIPDHYYEGSYGALWVEYKFITKLPPQIDLKDEKKFLSKHQQRWLLRAIANGVRTAVIVGHEKGGVIFAGPSWKYELTREGFISLMLTKEEIVGWIRNTVTK